MSTTQLTKLPSELLTELQKYVPAGSLILSLLDTRIPYPICRREPSPGHSSLNELAREGCLEHLAWFVDTREYIPERAFTDVNTLLRCCTQDLLNTGREDCIQFVLQRRLNASNLHYSLSGNTPLEVYEKYANKGLPPAYPDDSACRGNLPLLKKLLAEQRYAGDSRIIETCLRNAAYKQRWETLKWLLTVSDQDETWLQHICFESGYDGEELISLLLAKYSLGTLIDKFKYYANSVTVALMKRGYCPPHDVLHDCWERESIPLLKLLIKRDYKYGECCFEEIDAEEVPLEIIQIVASEYKFALPPQLCLKAEKKAFPWIVSQGISIDSLLDCYISQKIGIGHGSSSLLKHIPLQTEHLDKLLKARNRIGIEAFKTAYLALSETQRLEYIGEGCIAEAMSVLCETE